MSIRVIIADDEEMARVRLRRLLGKFFADIEVVGEATDGKEAKSSIENQKPDLAFLDIEMPGLNGIELAKSLPKEVFIIFVTAYNKYAIEAFKTMAIDYLLKPITEEDLQRAINKYKSLTVKPDMSELLVRLAEITNKNNTNKRLLVKVGDSVKFISYDDIVCFEADMKYTTVFTKSTTYITEFSLKELEEMLPNSTFMRIHRKHIVNSMYISECKKLGDRTYEVILTVPIKAELVVSRGFLDVLQKI
jgi:two-component system LytT family response regulator